MKFLFIYLLNISAYTAILLIYLLNISAYTAISNLICFRVHVTKIQIKTKYKDDLFKCKWIQYDRSIKNKKRPTKNSLV